MLCHELDMNVRLRTAARQNTKRYGKKKPIHSESKSELGSRKSWSRMAHSCASHRGLELLRPGTNFSRPGKFLWQPSPANAFPGEAPQSLPQGSAP